MHSPESVNPSNERVSQPLSRSSLDTRTRWKQRAAGAVMGAAALFSTPEAAAQQYENTPASSTRAEPRRLTDARELGYKATSFDVLEEVAADLQQDLRRGQVTPAAVAEELRRQLRLIVDENASQVARSPSEQPIISLDSDIHGATRVILRHALQQWRHEHEDDDPLPRNALPNELAYQLAYRIAQGRALGTQLETPLAEVFEGRLTPEELRQVNAYATADFVRVYARGLQHREDEVAAGHDTRIPDSHAPRFTRSNRIKRPIDE